MAGSAIPRSKSYKAGAAKGKRHAKKAASASPAFAKKVLAVLEKKAEKKYIADNTGTVGGLSGTNDNLLVPTGLVPLIPKLGQGTQSNQRIGQKISNAHGRVDFQFFFIGNGSGVYPTNDVYVRVYKLESKSAKSYGQVALLPGGTLLDQGNQTTSDWNAGTLGNSYGLVYSQMPLSHEDWRGTHKTIRLTKNQGVTNGDAASGQAPNTFGHPAGHLSMTWTHKGSILYDDTPTGGGGTGGPSNPTNFAPVYGVVAYNSDNTPFNSQVQFVTRIHMWYEDV
jgi:hypothetical protein